MPQVVGAMFFLFILLYLAVILAALAGIWAVFSKAGEPGWACLVPFYNLYVMTKVAGKPAWWMLLVIVPCVNIVGLFLLNHAIAKAFGKDIGYAFGLFLLPMVFWPMLGFGDAKYQGAA